MGSGWQKLLTAHTLQPKRMIQVLLLLQSSHCLPAACRLIRNSSILQQWKKHNLRPASLAVEPMFSHTKRRPLYQQSDPTTSLVKMYYPSYLSGIEKFLHLHSHLLISINTALNIHNALFESCNCIDLCALIVLFFSNWILHLMWRTD